MYLKNKRWNVKKNVFRFVYFALFMLINLLIMTPLTDWPKFSYRQRMIDFEAIFGQAQ